MDEQLGPDDVGRRGRVRQVRAQHAPDLLPQQPELGEHVGRRESLLKAHPGVALRRGEHGGVFEGRLGRDRAGRGAPQQGGQRVVQPGHVVGHGPLDVPQMERLDGRPRASRRAPHPAATPAKRRPARGRWRGRSARPALPARSIRNPGPAAPACRRPSSHRLLLSAGRTRRSPSPQAQDSGHRAPQRRGAGAPGRARVQCVGAARYSGRASGTCRIRPPVDARGAADAGAAGRAGRGARRRWHGYVPSTTGTCGRTATTGA